MSTTYDYNYGTHSQYIPGALRSKRLYEKVNMKGIANFIETGTYMGDGIKWALERTPRFDRIVSVEYAKGLADHAKILFGKFPNVIIEHGHSPEILSRLIPTIRTPTLFYLDAHEGGGHGVEWKSDEPCPLVGEVTQILHKFYDLNQAIIVVDDAGYLTGKVSGYPSIDVLIRMCKEKEMISCYLDDSVIFSKPSWIMETSQS